MYYVFAKDVDVDVDTDEYGKEGTCLCRIPIDRTIGNGRPFIIQYRVKHDTSTGETVIEYDNGTVDDDNDDELPPVINDCKSCGYSCDVSTGLYVGKHVHPLVYCRHHEVMCLASRMPCEWAMYNEEK